MSSKPTIEDSSDNMENIELHRADSMVNPPLEFENQVENEPPNEKINVYTYVSSKAVFIFSEVIQLKIEVVMFMYMFSAVMRQISSTTMVMDKVCLVHLGFSEDECKHLELYMDQKIQVETIANNYNTGHGIISMLPSCILAIFIGSWSDKYGRKVPVIVALIGIILDGLGSTICAVVLYSRVEFFLLSGLFTGCSGGFISVLTVLYSYASDTTTFGQRTLKFAIMEVAFGLSMPLGQLAGGWLFKYTGYVPVFLTSTAGHVFCLGWVLFVLKETKGLDNTDSWRVKLGRLWSLRPVIDSIKTTFKVRPNKGREQILLLVLAMSMTVLSHASAGSISFLYVHHVYDWGNTKYSTIAAIFAVIGTVCMLISVPIFKSLKLGDPTLGIVGNASLLAKNIALGLAVKEELFFLAQLLGILGGLGTLSGRSRISKVTSMDDLGKVFSFLSTAESLLPIIAILVVSQVFNASLSVYPGLVFFGLGALLIIPILIYIWLSRLPSVNYEEMQNSPPDVEAIIVPKKTDVIQIMKY